MNLLINFDPKTLLLGRVLFLYLVLWVTPLQAHLVDGNSPLVLPSIEVEVTVENDGVHSRVHIPLRIFLEDVLKIEVPPEILNNIEDSSSSNESKTSSWEEEAFKIYKSLDQSEVTKRIQNKFVEFKHIIISKETPQESEEPSVSNLEIQLPKFKNVQTQGPKALKYSAVQFDLYYKSKSPPKKASIIWQLFPKVSEKTTPLDSIKKTG